MRLYECCCIANLIYAHWEIKHIHVGKDRALLCLADALPLVTLGDWVYGVVKCKLLYPACSLWNVFDLCYLNSMLRRSWTDTGSKQTVVATQYGWTFWLV